MQHVEPIEALGLSDWLSERMIYAGKIVKRDEIRVTIDRLKALRAYRSTGAPVSYTTDPEWLLDQAINRKAGWPEDPSTVRGSAMPLPDGSYPKRADGDRSYRNLHRLARMINQPGLVVYAGEATALPTKHRDKLSHRLTWPDDV